MEQGFLSLTPMRKSTFWSYQENGNVEIIAIKSETQKELARLYDDKISGLEISEDDGVKIHLNHAGTKIWELCDGTNTVGDIANTLSQEFNIQKEELIGDIEEFLKYCESVDVMNNSWKSIE